jgi:hypothetical protein
VESLQQDLLGLIQVIAVIIRTRQIQQQLQGRRKKREGGRSEARFVMLCVNETPFRAGNKGAEALLVSHFNPPPVSYSVVYQTAKAQQQGQQQRQGCPL